MRGQNVGKRVRLHALDPQDAAANHAIAHFVRNLPAGSARKLSENKPGFVLVLRTAGCFDRLPLTNFSLDPDLVNCARCKAYLKKHPQYVNYLRELSDAVKTPEPPPSAA